MVLDLSGGRGYQTEKDGDNIAKFIDELCTRIEMVKYGPLTKEWFGTDGIEGWSVVQLIMTSSITGHFCGEYKQFPETSNTAYIDVFSCKDFDCNEVVSVVKKFFNPDRVSYLELVRERPSQERRELISSPSTPSCSLM